MNNDEIAIRMSTVNKVLQVAQQCVDPNKRGWFLRMPVFWDAMDGFNFGGREVRAVLAFLQAKMYVIVVPDEDSHIAGITLVPERYRCWHCNMLLDIQDSIRRHFDDCRKRQVKIERGRKLL